MPSTLSIPNLADSYAQRVTHNLGGRPRSQWLAGCGRSSTLGLLWGPSDRAVLCPSQWDPSIAEDLGEALGLRLSAHRIPEDLTLPGAELEVIAERLRAFDSGSGFRVLAWSATSRLHALVAALVERGVLISAAERSALPRWTDEYLDSKVGLRQFAQRPGLSKVFRLPAGVVCTHLEQAFESATSLLRAGHARVVLKADRGAGGLGQFVADAGLLGWNSKKRSALARVVPLLATSPIVVEAWIEHGAANPTPSVMFEIGEQGVEYVGTAATFMAHGTTHAGAVVGDGALPEQLERFLGESGRALAEHAQALGHRGPLSLDTVVDREGQVYLLEINPRRTMVSHCHFVRHVVFGGVEQGAVASCEGAWLGSAEVGSYAAVRRRLGKLWYRPERRCGLLVSHFAPPSHENPATRLSLVGIDCNAAAAIGQLRQAFLSLSTDVPPSIEAAWRQTGSAGGSL